ncbi:MAG: hypothetical protein U0Y68_22190 [Blastocatellia bacterium]
MIENQQQISGQYERNDFGSADVALQVLRIRAGKRAVCLLTVIKREAQFFLREVSVEIAVSG